MFDQKRRRGRFRLFALPLALPIRIYLVPGILVPGTGISKGKATQILVDSNIVNKYVKSPVEMNVGEMMFFSGFLSHRSGNNVSNNVRYSLVGMFHDVKHKPFFAPKVCFEYRNSSPKEYYDELFSK